MKKSESEEKSSIRLIFRMNRYFKIGTFLVVINEQRKTKHYLFSFQVGLILCFFHVSCANGVFLVEKVVQNVTFFCKRCKPGYQASKFCQDAILSGIYRSIDEENATYLYNNFQVSSCTPCPVGKFSVGYVENQTCLKCSYCEPGFFASKSCNSTSDTLCIPDTFKGVHEYYFKSKKPLSFTSSPRGEFIFHLQGLFYVHPFPQFSFFLLPEVFECSSVAISSHDITL